MEYKDKVGEKMINTLNNIITELKAIYRKTDNSFSKIETEKENLDKLNYLVTSFDNLEDIIKININEIKDVLSDNDLKELSNNFDKDYNELVVVLKAKYIEQLGIELTNKQNDFLTKLKNILNSLFKKKELKYSKLEIKEEKNKEKKKDLEERILNLEIIIEKISNLDDTSLLTSDDFYTIYNEIMNSNLSYEEKKNILINFRKYNIERQNNIDKSLNQDNKIDIDLLKTIFNNYGLDSITKLIDKSSIIRDEVSKNANINKIKDILDYLNDNQILRRFTPDALLTICVYGDLETLKQRYQILKNNTNNAIYEYPSIWLKTGKRTYKRNNLPTESTPHPKAEKKVLLNQASRNSYEEIINIENYLKGLGFRVSFQNKENISILVNIPLDYIKENYNILNNYGIFNIVSSQDFSLSALNSPFLQQRLDTYIELGLLHPVSSNPLGNYYPHNPTLSRWLKDNYISYLYYYKENHSDNEYYDYLASKSYSQSIKGSALKNNEYVNSLTDEKLEQFNNENFGKMEDYIPNKNVYDYIIDKSSSEDNNLNTIPMELQYLEDNFRVPNNEYVYKFDNIIISRLKVIRTYNTLIKSDILIDKDGLLYAIINNSKLSDKAIRTIAKSINYELEKRQK